MLTLWIDNAVVSKRFRRGPFEDVKHLLADAIQTGSIRLEHDQTLLCITTVIGHLLFGHDWIKVFAVHSQHGSK